MYEGCGDDSTYEEVICCRSETAEVFLKRFLKGPQGRRTAHD